MLLSFWLFQYCENNFTSLLIKAEELDEELDAPPIFKPKWTVSTEQKSLFDYESQDQVTMDAYETVQTEYFLMVMDQAVQLMQTRFEQYDEQYNKFGFLYSIQNCWIWTMRAHWNAIYKDLDLLLQTSTCRQVDGIELFNCILLFFKNF